MAPTMVVPNDVRLADVSADELTEILKDAHIPSLLVTLAFLTGDLTLLKEEFRPATVSVSLGMDPSGGLSPEVQESARRVALEALLRYREEGNFEPARLNTGQLQELMQFITGPVDEAYIPLMIHELGIPVDLGAPTWNKQDVAPGTTFRVAIIGAGMSGLVAAHRLQQAGIPYIVFERSIDVGGVWLDNDYPGARLDTSNFTYSYSFSQHGTWEDQYSTRDAVLGYLQGVADDFGIRENIRFNTKVTSAIFDDDAGTWTLTVTGPDGTEEITTQAVISAVGQLNEPNIPDIEGARNFKGHSWHTARWNHDVDLSGKRVAVIGTGASAFQVIPKIAEIASQLTVFQRTPAWVIPTPGYTKVLPVGLRWLLENLQHYHRFYRFNQFWVNVDGIRYLAVVDPEWKHPVSVSEKNEGMRAALETFLRTSFADRQDLADKLVPKYPPYAKRTLRDDGTWSSALRRENVTMVTDRITRITETGVETEDGTLHEVDAIVYGTGFRASDFLSTLKLKGKGGKTLDEQWGGDARAYYGITIPNFPNLFCLYGPNTNLNVNGSVVLFSEAAVEYTLACIQSLLESNHKTMEIRQEPFDEFNKHIDDTSKTLAVGVSDVNSWYKNKFGRVSQNWPLTTLDYWEGTRGPRPGDYDYK
jgi:4-hydroxyacetophenone monooxygenase